MGEQKYRLVPADIDLTGDGHGHHIPGTPQVYKHGWKLIGHHKTTSKHSLKGPGFSSSSTHTDTHKKFARELKTGEIRQTLTMDRHQRDEVFNAAGFHSEYHEDDISLIHKLHETQDAKEREKIASEMEVRLRAMKTGLATYHEANRLAEREDKRSRLRKFDDHLKGSKMGRALIKIRDKIVSDGALDKKDATKKGLAEYGKDWAKHLANVKLAAILIASSASLSGALLDNEHTPEAVRHFLENPVAESGVAAATAIAIAMALKALGKARQKAKERKAARP